jgi:hypothetical protein
MPQNALITESIGNFPKSYVAMATDEDLARMLPKPSPTDTGNRLQGAAVSLLGTVGKWAASTSSPETDVTAAAAAAAGGSQTQPRGHSRLD